MKRKFLILFMAFTLTITSVMAGNVFYKSAMHLVASVPDDMDIEVNDATNLMLTTPDEGFSILGIAFSLQDHTRKEILDGMYQLAEEVSIDISNAGYLNLDTRTMHGLIAAVKDDDGILYSYAVFDDGEHAYIFQVLARPKYHNLLDRFFETVEYYTE